MRGKNRNSRSPKRNNNNNNNNSNNQGGQSTASSQLGYKFLQDEALVRKWIEEVLQEKVVGSLERFLADGTILCRLANKVRPNSITTIHPSGSPAYLLLENINIFLTICMEFGLTNQEMFIPIDLFEQKNLHKTVNCLIKLSEHAASLGFKPFYQKRERIAVLLRGDCRSKPIYCFCNRTTTAP